jgi:hypothetical protein
MRESCKARGHPRREAAARGKRWRGEIPTGVSGMGETMELTSGARVAVTEERCSRRAAQTQRRGGFWQLRQGRAGRDGPSACARPVGGGAPGRVAELRGRTGRLAAGPFWAESEEKFFSE